LHVLQDKHAELCSEASYCVGCCLLLWGSDASWLVLRPAMDQSCKALSAAAAGCRVKFFQLADIFLASGMVPAYTAAAFAKKMARLALRAPPAGEQVPTQDQVQASHFGVNVRENKLQPQLSTSAHLLLILPMQLPAGGMAGSPPSLLATSACLQAGSAAKKHALHRPGQQWYQPNCTSMVMLTALLQPFQGSL
jgi:hypothetical protein